MNSTINKVEVTGILVSKGLEKKVVTQNVNNVPTQKEIISGNIVLRTKDGSEIEVEYYTARLNKQGNENKLYKGLETVITEYKSLENSTDGTSDIIRIGGAELKVNDYKGQDGELKSFAKVKANFANRLSLQDIELTPQVATFEAEGLIAKIKDEMIKEEITGNLIIEMEIFGYEGTIIPVKLFVPQSIVEGFRSSGYYDGCVAKLSGNIINTKANETVTEQVAFGTPITKTITKTIKRFEVTGGNQPKTIYDLKITEEEYNQAKSKRNLKLDEIKNKVATQTNTNAFSQTPTVTPTSTPSPFGNAPTNFNPFAQK